MRVRYCFTSLVEKQGCSTGPRQPVSRCLLGLGRCLQPGETTNTNCLLAPGWRCAAGDEYLKIALFAPMSGGHKAT